MLPAIVHIKHQPPVYHGDGPIVSVIFNTIVAPYKVFITVFGIGTHSRARSASSGLRL